MASLINRRGSGKKNTQVTINYDNSLWEKM
jgi:hypothetical protein